MDRRKFIKESSFAAVAVYALGNISWKENKFIGDSITTTDILGPFYRPDSPFRTSINPPGFTGEKLYLNGTIYKSDGHTPFNGCLVEIWQCNPQGKYDNVSDQFIFRGRQMTKFNGKYKFITTQPVPYGARPAHIHMRISGKGQQDIITQIYFKGDPHISGDSAANHPDAINRILEVKTQSNGDKHLTFDVFLGKEVKPSDNFFSDICGLYETKNGNIEFERLEDLLLVKVNGQIIASCRYKGGNQFIGSAASEEVLVEFIKEQDKPMKVQTASVIDPKNVSEGVKIMKY